MKDRPEAAKRYETEERELIRFLDLAAGEEGDTDAAVLWLDRTLYEHREQARAEALQESFHGTWWDRNWFGLAFLGLIVLALLAIGLVNGWS